MSINSAMLAGVSGLTANSSALAAISDNIANVNTVGYKRSQSNFMTLVTNYSSSSRYNAGGVTQKTHQFISQVGLTSRTSSGTDLAIDGQGFFVTTEKPEGVTSADARTFTRAGSFQKDDLGYLRNDAGGYLQGWPVDDNGDIVTDPSDLTKLSAINVSQIGGAAEATTRASVTGNLKSSQPVSAEFAAYNPATNSMAMYDPATGVGVKPDFTMQVPVSDSKGGKRTVELDFLKTDVPNQWQVEVRAVPASDVVSGAGLSNGQIMTGTLAFTADGKLDLANSTLFPDATNPVLTIGASDAAAPGAGQVNWASGLGIAAQTINLDLGATTGGLSQLDSPSSLDSVTTNGTAFGTVQDVQIDEDGFVTAVFDNGITRKIAQVAVATFPNPDGLTAISGNGYRVSQSSGTFTLKTPGAGGAGLLSPSTLENSTVDLSTEFTGLITTQRAYSASSKIITTADQMLEELINIKR